MVQLFYRRAFIVLLVMLGGTLPGFAQNPPPNPLKQLFNQLDRKIKNGPEEAEQKRHSKDQLDLRLPQRPEDQRRLRQAQAMIQAERWHEAIEILQFLVDRGEDTFSSGVSGEFSSLQETIRTLIGNLPEAGRRSYRNRFGPVAQAMLNTARKNQDEEQLRQLSHRYFHTAAGIEAAKVLAELWTDRGELLSASRMWQRLAVSADQQDQRNEFAERAALALARSGELDRALDLAKQLDVLNEPFRTRLNEVEPFPDTRTGDTPPFLPSPASQVRQVESIDPLLIPEWSASLTRRVFVQEQIEMLLRDVKDQQRAVVPAERALVVNGRLAFRTMEGLQVRDLSSGQLLWEKRLSPNPEELLTTGHPRNPDDDIIPYNGAMFEHHQLASLLFRDSVTGTLTSDGRQLFVVESRHPLATYSSGFAWRRVSRDVDPDQAGWNSNELVAYDLKTGYVRWRIGGTRIEDRFSRPLAGSYFFGPPVADGGDLFVIGEQSGEVLLFCLSARTGELIWSQPLCTPGRPIEEDLVRRFWSCLPVIKDGLVICPTTCGWLVAVERRTRQLSWAYRYAPHIEQQGRFRGGFAVQSLQELNRRWPASRPVVFGNRLLVSPVELPDEFGMTEPILVCLDAATGREIWKQPKGRDELYLAGLVGERAILVGKTLVLSRNIEKGGHIAWQISLPETQQFPSGRGLITNGRLYLPVSMKTILTIDLEKGDILGQTTLPSCDVHLGNLSLHGDSIVSASPLDVSVFPAQKGEFLQASHTLGLGMRIRRAELRIANREFDRALQSLTEIEQAAEFQSLSTSERERLHQLLWECLVELIQADLQNADPWFTEMRSRAVSESDQWTYQRLLAEQQRALGNWRRAFEGYQKLLETASPQLMVNDGTREVRVDGWVGGRLQRMFGELSMAEQEELTSMLREWFESLPARAQLRSAMARVCSFHPLGQEFELELSRTSLGEGRQGEAMLRLQRALMSADDDIAEKARRALEDVCQEYNALPNEEREILAAPQGRYESWGEQWELFRGGGGGMHREGIATASAVGETLSFLQQIRFQYDLQSQRIRIIDPEQGGLTRSLPLKTMSALEHNPNVGIRWVGALALVMHRGVLHAIDFPERKITWTFTPEVEGLGAARLRTPVRQSRLVMQALGSFVSSNRLGHFRSPTGYLLDATPNALLVLARDLIALDPLTGETLWREHDIEQRMTAHASGEDFVLFAAGHGPESVSSLDGSRTSLDWLGRHDHAAFALLGKDLILLKDANEQPTLMRIPYASDEPLWKHQIEPRSLAVRPEPDSICWLTPAGSLHHVDLQTGAHTELGRIPQEILKSKRQVSILSDSEQFYVVVDTGNAHVSYVNMASVRTSGSILAFRRQGGLSWSREMESLWKEIETADSGDAEPSVQPAQRWSLNVLVEQFEETPLVLLVGDRPGHRKGFHYRRLRLIGLDKRTGQSVVQWERPSDSTGFSYLHVDVANRFIELRTYTERLKMRPVRATENASEQVE